ncbi:MAG: hypothetical protein KIT25_10000 [Enhydrobacter sp.]|nr:MAG: hypothetical protein KIT25_10000 [Enhydrobacter sp.]
MALSVASAHAEDCNALVPEVANDLIEAPVPKAENRWRAIERIWRESFDLVRQDVERSLRNSGISPVADVIQGRTHDPLREAIIHGRDDLAHSLLAIWQMPLDVLSKRDRVNVYYLTPERRHSEARLAAEHAMWVGPDGFESVLYSAIYLAGATDVVVAITRRPADKRSRAMVKFAKDIGELALDHYKRWAFGPPKIWQVRGWGCEASGLDLVEFTRRRLDRSLGNGRLPYCVAPTDIDMLIAIGITNLLAVGSTAPELVTVPDDDRGRLVELLRVQSQFFASRVEYGFSADAYGKFTETADFDPATWASHPDFVYVGNDSPAFPALPVSAGIRVGWDFAHGVRIAWTALALAEHGLDHGFDWARFADAFAGQVAHRVLDDKADVPRFRNYLDGSNGWYRVNPVAGTGIPPFGLSRAFLAAPWAHLGARDDRLVKATRVMWKALAAPTPEQCRLLKEIYVEGSYWKDRKPAGAPISGPYYGLHLLPFLAVAPVR